MAKLPHRPEKEFDAVREAVKSIAQSFVHKYPDLATLEMRKDKRAGKVFIDYLRNSYGQTTISPYSLRATKNASVATPLEWDELSDKLTSQSFHAKNIFRRLSQKQDPWKNISKYQCTLDTIEMKRE